MKLHKIMCLIGVLAFVVLFLLVFMGAASTNDLPAAAGGTISVNANGVVYAPDGFCASNGLALVNPPVQLYDVSFSDWGTADGITWTNATGWTSTAVVTNGVCDLTANSLLSPWITGRGLEAVSVTWSNLVSLEGVTEYTTNDSDWAELAAVSDIRFNEAGYRLRFTAVASVPGFGDTVAQLARVIVWGHQFPERIGSTNDYAGITMLVDDPSGLRDAVNLHTLDNRIAAVQIIADTPVNWSLHPAIQPVDFAGKPLILDPRYTLAVSNDVLSLTFGSQAIWEITGGGTVTPRIVSFTVDGNTNVTIGVVGSTGWMPYPEWSVMGASNVWIRIPTNNFTSTYPNLTNGIYTLSFAAATNVAAFYRVVAVNVDGATNTLGLTFHVPLVAEQPVTGPGMGDYVTAQGLAGAVAPLVTTGMLDAAVSGLVTTQALATVISGLNTNPPDPLLWIRSIDLVTNMVITSTNGADYNGPVVGQFFCYYDVDAGTYQATNPAGELIYVIDRPLSPSQPWACSGNYSYFTNATALGTYLGYSSGFGWSGTGSFVTAASLAYQTNWTPYFDNGTGTFRHISGPCTNDFASTSDLARTPKLDLSNTYGIWTTQVCDSIDIVDSVIVTNQDIYTNVLVSGSADPSPNSIYWQYSDVTWAQTNVDGGISIIGYASGRWGINLYSVYPGAYWTNSTFLGNYAPACSYDGYTWTNSGTAYVSVYSIVTNTAFITNRTVRMRLNPDGFEFLGTNATWKSQSVITGVQTNDSGVVTGIVSQIIRFLGAP